MNSGNFNDPRAEEDRIVAGRWADLLSGVERDAPAADAAMLRDLRGCTLARYEAARRSVAAPASGPRGAARGRVVRWIAAGAAAAAVLALAVGMFTVWTHPRPAYGMADVPALMRGARTLHVQSFRWAYGPDPQFPNFEKVTLLPMEDWIDVPNVRRHSLSFMSWTPSDTHERHLDGVEVVVDGPTRMELRHAKKKVSYHQRSLLDHRLESRHLMHQSLNILAPDQMGQYQKVGREQLDGKPFDIWERVHEGADRRRDKEGKEFQKKYTMRVRCWLSPDTGDVGRVEQWVKHEPTGMWRPEYFMEKVERDVPIPAEKFGLEAPEGYEQENTPQKPFVDWRGAWAAPFGGADVIGYVALTLDDGSVVLGYSAVPRWPDREKMQKEPEEAQKKAESEWLRARAAEQEPLFADFKPGGPLPALPAICVGLRSFSQPYRSGAEASYTGYHLARTRYENRLIEWALYVPDQKLATRPPLSVYVMRVGAGGAGANAAPVDFNPMYGDPLFGKDEFDTFVRGCIAERSDTGAAPPDITYEKVTKLASDLASRPTR